jgi:hypothetical protein
LPSSGCPRTTTASCASAEQKPERTPEGPADPCVRRVDRQRILMRTSEVAADETEQAASRLPRSPTPIWAAERNRLSTGHGGTDETDLSASHRGAVLGTRARRPAADRIGVPSVLRPVTARYRRSRGWRASSNCVTVRGHGGCRQFSYRPGCVASIGVFPAGSLRPSRAWSLGRCEAGRCRPHRARGSAGGSRRGTIDVSRPGLGLRHATESAFVSPRLTGCTNKTIYARKDYGCQS